MQIVIDIGEAIYKECIPYKDTPIISNLANYNSEIIHAVANGTPLPKGHGDLKDADEMKRRMGNLDGVGMIGRCIDEFPTIIEADKSESEDKA